MPSPKYEYGFIVNTLELKIGLADATSEEVSQGMALALSDLAKSLSKAVQTAPQGPWEIVSHDLTRIDRHLIVTFLSRRSVQ